MDSKNNKAEIFELTQLVSKNIKGIQASSFAVMKIFTEEKLREVKIGDPYLIQLSNKSCIKINRLPDEGTSIVFFVEMDPYSYWPPHLHPNLEEVIVVKKGSLMCYETNKYAFYDNTVLEEEQEHNKMIISKGVKHFLKTDEFTSFSVKLTPKK